MIDNPSLQSSQNNNSGADVGSKDSGQINVMVVDDSAVIRGLFVGVLEHDSQIKVVATANNGQVAIDTLKRMVGKIDVITLDIEMPEKGGLEALPELLEISPDVKIIIASTLSKAGARETMVALTHGANDYLAKPVDRTDKEAMYEFTNALVRKVNALGRKAIADKGVFRAEEKKEKIVKVPATITLRKQTIMTCPSALVIGSSTGGPQALMAFFSRLKGKKLYAPIFITQHMPAEFTSLLAKQLRESSGFEVHEGIDGEEVKSHMVYIAPGDRHMLVARDGTKRIIRITQDEPENFCRPAVDPMLRSITDAYGGGKTLLMILTGMGADGCKSAKSLVDAGGTVIAQDEETSVVWGMPGAVATAGICSHVLPLDKLSDKFVELSQGQIR